MAVELAILNQAIADALKDDAELSAWRGGGDTEVLPFGPPVDDDGVFQIVATRLPYICVSSVAPEIIRYDGEASTSDTRLVRQVIGVLHTGRATFEGDARLKEFWRHVYRVLGELSLSNLGVKGIRVTACDVDGLGPTPQAAFGVELELIIPGAGVMSC